MKKINFKKLLAFAFIPLLLLGGLGISNIIKNSDNKINDGEILTDVISNGVTVKKLSSGTNDNGQSYVTYSYTVTPDYATNKNIFVKTLAFTDLSVDDNPSAYVNVSINNSASTFTVTQLAAFSNQLTLTLASEADITVTCDVTIDCKQKWLGFTTVNEFEFYFSQTGSTTLSGYDSNLRNSVDGGYSDIYTIPLTTSQASISREVVEVNECYSNNTSSGYVVSYDDLLTTSDEETLVLKSHVDSLLDGGSFNFNNCYSLKDPINNTWSDEKKLEIMNYKYYGFRVVEDATCTLYGETKTFRLYTYWYYYVSGLNISISPTALSVENNQVIF